MTNFSDWSFWLGRDKDIVIAKGTDGTHKIVKINNGVAGQVVSVKDNPLMVFMMVDTEALTHAQAVAACYGLESALA